MAHNEGLGVNWKTRRAFWADRAPNESALRTIFSPWLRRVRAMSEAIPMSIAITRICGPMNSIFSVSPARPRFKATYSMTTELMSTPIRSGKLG